MTIIIRQDDNPIGRPPQIFEAPFTLEQRLIFRVSNFLVLVMKYPKIEKEEKFKCMLNKSTYFVQ